MKLAWKPRIAVCVLVVVLPFFQGNSQANAQIIEHYNPTLDYTIHSVSKGDPDQDPQTVGFTPEAGASGIPREVSEITQSFGSETSQSPISPFFKAATNFFSQGVLEVGSFVSSAVSALEVLITSGASTVWNQVSKTVFSAFSLVYQGIDLLSLGVSTLQAQAERISQPMWTFFGSLFTLGGLSFMFSIPQARSLFFSSTQMGLSAIASVADLVLHVLAGALAGFQTLIFGTSFGAAYQTAKSWIKKKINRDIGSFTQDLVATALVVVVGVSLMYGGAILSGASKMVANLAEWLSGPTGTYVLLKNQQAVSETTQECQIPGQCNTYSDVGITYGFNLAFAGLPDFETDRVAMSAKNQVLQQVGQSGDEVIEEVAPQVGKTVGEWRNVVEIDGKQYIMTDHSVDQLMYRKIFLNDIENSIKNGEKFSYYHEGQWKIGFYDHKSKIFVGTVDNKVLSVFKTSEKYILNKKGANP